MKTSLQADGLDRDHLNCMHQYCNDFFLLAKACSTEAEKRKFLVSCGWTGQGTHSLLSSLGLGVQALALAQATRPKGRGRAMGCVVVL